MSLAPTPILKAGLWILHRAILTLRDATYPGSTISTQSVNDLADAVHNIPQSLLEWDESKHLEEIRTFLKAFDANSWPDGSAPNFLNIFEEKLKEEMEKDK